MNSVKDERKQLLRDWMVASIQMAKVKEPTLKTLQITDMLNGFYGLKLNEKWTNRALYGHESKIPGGVA